MIAHLGHYALCFSGLIALISLPLLFKKNLLTLRLLKSSLCLQFYGVSIALGSLMYAFAVSDFSVIQVALHSHRAMPLIYKIAATWSTHEGSMLLWMCIQSTYSMMYALQKRPHNAEFEHHLASVLIVLNLAVLAFIIYTSNPLVTLDVMPETMGRGLNPLLEDPLLSIHPPILYLGYIGLIVPFAAACAQSTCPFSISIWTQSVHVWILWAWICLTTGILLGSFWAYYELGWGGWWFWDPVENAALIPWLISTSLLHVCLTLKKHQKFYYLTIALSLLGFLSSLSGTFLVRSGAISSIHAFAQDPTRGSLILLFIILLTIAASFFWMKAFSKSSLIASLKLRKKSPSSPQHILGWISYKNLIGTQAIGFLGLALITILGTFYPLIHQMITGQNISVDPSFYHTVVVPLFLMIASLMGLTSYTRTRHVQFITCATIAGSVGSYLWIYQESLSFLYAITLSLGLWIMLTSLRSFQWNLKKLSMTGAHTAVGFFLIAAAIERHGLQEETLTLQPGETKTWQAFSLHLQHIDNLQAPYYQEQRATLMVNQGTEAHSMHMQKKFYPLHNQLTTKTALWQRWDGDLQATLGPLEAENRWSIIVSWHPMINGLWIAWLSIIAFGGLAFAQVARSKHAPSDHKYPQ